MQASNTEPLNKKLLAYFTIDTYMAGCMIVSWMYSLESLDYPREDENNPQLIMPLVSPVEPDWAA